MNYDLIESIDPDPVIEAIVEFRFSPNVPGTVVMGIFYNALKGEFSKLEELPLLQMPEAIRNQDANLKYKAVHKLIGDGVDVQIGPRVVSINGRNESGYMRWGSYSKVVFDVIKKVFTTGAIDKVERIGVRYISFFPDLNVYEKIRLLVDLEERSNITQGNTSFVTEIQEEEVVSRLSIQNHATFNRNGKPVGTGSVVDIDSYCTDHWDNHDVVIKTIEDCHRKEKRLFFSLLKDDFLRSMKPVVKSSEEDG